MGGILISNQVIGGHLAFSLDHPGTIAALAAVPTNMGSFQADGDELKAIIWGLQNYKKYQQTACITCNGEAELWAKDGTGMCCRCVAVAMVEYQKAKKEETPVQQQLQYQDEQCPNCLKSGGVYDLDSRDVSADVIERGDIHGCHNCGMTWRLAGFFE